MELPEIKDFFDPTEILSALKEERIEKNHKIAERLNKKGIKIKIPSGGFMAS